MSSSTELASRVRLSGSRQAFLYFLYSLDRCVRFVQYAFTPLLAYVVKVALNNGHILVNWKKVKESFFFSYAKQESYNKYFYRYFYVSERSFMYFTVSCWFLNKFSALNLLQWPLHCKMWKGGWNAVRKIYCGLEARYDTALQPVKFTNGNTETHKTIPMDLGLIRPCT